MTPQRAAVNAFLFWGERRPLTEIGYTGLNTPELDQLQHLADVHGCDRVDLVKEVQAIALDEWYRRQLRPHLTR